jgi:hypothetical protein
MRRFVKRMVAGVIIFFLPVILNLIFSWAGEHFKSGTCNIGNIISTNIFEIWKE